MDRVKARATDKAQAVPVRAARVPAVPGQVALTRHGPVARVPAVPARAR